MSAGRTNDERVDQKMSLTLMEVASHRIGTMRFGRHAIPGQGRLADAIGKWAGWIGGGHGVASPWPGVQFEADLNDRIQRQMWAGVYEQHVRECFDVLLKPGDVYLDVGAQVGFHAVFAAHRVGPEGHVFAFEADPQICRRLAAIFPNSLGPMPQTLPCGTAPARCGSGALPTRRSLAGEP